MHRRRLAIALLAVAAACGGDDGEGSGAARSTISVEPVAAEYTGDDDGFYDVPDPLPDGAHGDLVRWQRLDSDTEDGAWRVMYLSESVSGDPIAVTGVVAAPAGTPPADRPVVTWAHGTAGIADRCAPSKDPEGQVLGLAGPFLERGWVFAATDYEGLGTPGIPTSTVALAEAHAALDSIRAVAALPNVGPLGDVVLAGHSQGGRAALFAAEIAPVYAPELTLVGAVALAPGVELPMLVDHVATSPLTGVALMGAIGLRAGYPALDLSTVFTPSAIADIPRVETECVDETFARYRPLATSAVISRRPSSLPDLKSLLEENSPGQHPPSVPVFIGHGDADQQVPIAVSHQLATKYCALDVNVSRHTYAGQDHDAIVDAAASDAMAFITNRFDDNPASGTC